MKSYLQAQFQRMWILACPVQLSCSPELVHEQPTKPGMEHKGMMHDHLCILCIHCVN